MTQKLVIYGNCQGLVLETALRGMPHIQDRYTVTRHDVMLEGEALEASLPDYADADLLLIQQIQRWRSHPMRNRLSPDATVVFYPGLGLLSVWPFDRIVAGNDPAFVQFQPFAFGDHALGQLRTLIPDPAERLHAYRSLSWPGAPDRVELQRNQAFERSRLARMDEKFDSRLGQFILDHYQAQALFHAVHHPTGVLMTEFTAEVLTKAGLYDAAIRDMNLDLVAQWQVPFTPWWQIACVFNGRPPAGYTASRARPSWTSTAIVNVTSPATAEPGIELISVHVPKCAGNALLHGLQEVFGQDAVFRDYGDRPIDPASPMNLDPDGFLDRVERSGFTGPAQTRAVHGTSTYGSIAPSQHRCA